MPPRRPRHLPRPDEKLLLLAASAEPAPAAAAWIEWRRSHDLDACDKTSIDLLPAVYRNLEARTELGADRARLHGTYRRTWVYNQLQLRSARELLETLARRDVPTVVLKGAAVLTRYYRDPGVRPMLDVDVLLPLAQAAAVYSDLLADGWRPIYPAGGEFDHVMRVIHSLGLVRNGRGLDVHWHALASGCDAGDDDEFWDAAEPLEIAGVVTACLCPADFLLHSLAHGTRWSRGRSLLWALDGMTIIGTEPALDWARLIDQSRKRSVTLAVLVGLRYLRDELGAPVPAAVIDALARSPKPLRERLDERAQDTADTLAGLVARDVLDYLQVSRRWARGDLLPGFTWFLQAKYDVRRPALLPVDFTRRLLLRAATAFRGKGERAAAR